MKAMARDVSAGNSSNASMDIGAKTQPGYQRDEGRFFQYAYKDEVQERRAKLYFCRSCKRTFPTPQGLNGHQNHHKKDFRKKETCLQDPILESPKHAYVHENPDGWVLALETPKKRPSEEKEVESTELDLTLKL